MWVRSLGREDPLEEGMATHSSILTWRIPWTEEPGGLQSMEELDTTKLEATQHMWVFLQTFTNSPMMLILCKLGTFNQYCIL